MAEKKCKYCAMMIPVEAKICPYCRKKQTSTLLTFIAALFFIFLIIGVIRNMEQGQPYSKDASILQQLIHGIPTPKKAEQRTVEERAITQPLPHTVSDIHVQALGFMNMSNKKQYKGRNIVITGVISNVFIPPLSVQMKMAKQGLSADAFIYFSDQPASDVTETLIGNGVSCYLDASLAAKASQIYSGQTITMRCKYKSENILEACTLADESPQSGLNANLARGKQTDCLKPGPDTVILSGKLERHTYPGRPNYEDIKKGDQPETGFYLLLKEPVCYVGDELSDPKQNVSLIQLVLDQKGYDELRPYLGKIIKLKGSLFGSHTGHHHTPILLENIVLSEPINSQEYVEYCNERYGFCVNYPSNLKKERPPDNGDGQRFNDGKGFLMIVSGINNGLDDNLKTEMASQSKYFDKITYQTYKDNWFVLSGYKGSNILYLKTYVGRSSINHLYIQFPSSQKSEYDNVVTKISKSFKSGNLNDFQ